MPKIMYYCCKAMEKSSNDQRIIEAIGEPVVKDPWYNASLAVTHKHQFVSCLFPVSGPRGTGMFQLKAVCNEDDSWFSFLRPSDWEILILEALLHVPENDKKQQTFTIYSLLVILLLLPIDVHCRKLAATAGRPLLPPEATRRR